MQNFHNAFNNNNNIHKRSEDDPLNGDPDSSDYTDDDNDSPEPSGIFKPPRFHSSGIQNHQLNVNGNLGKLKLKRPFLIN